MEHLFRNILPFEGHVINLDVILLWPIFDAYRNPLVILAEHQVLHIPIVYLLIPDPFFGFDFNLDWRNAVEAMCCFDGKVAL